jgi:hypothetical protein
VEAVERGDGGDGLGKIESFLLGAAYTPGSLGKAYKLFHAGRPGDALAMAECVRAPEHLPPEAAKSFLGVVEAFRGDCLLAMGRTEDALYALRRSCEVDPNSVASWKLAALALEQRSVPLAQLAMRYLPTDGPEVTIMARTHGVAVEDVRQLAKGE